MDLTKLDNDELLHLSLEAMNASRDADSIVILKTLLERDNDHAHARYLLAAQYAQIGMYDRAEEGFRGLIESRSALPAARFQFAQLLLMKGATDEARDVLAPVAPQQDALGAYARALIAVSRENIADAISEIKAGLLQPQEIPALAFDMQQLCNKLVGDAGGAVAAVPQTGSAPLFLTGYAREE